MDNGLNTMELSPSEVNKDIFESYTVTTFRDRIGLYGQRLILRLLEAAYDTGFTQGKKFKKDDCRQFSPSEVLSDLCGHTTIVLPMSTIMGDSKEYSKVKNDIKLCMSEIISYQDSDGGDVMFPFLTYAKCVNGEIRLEVREELWNAVLDYSRGFRKFELQRALQLKTKYSLRLYQLMSGQTERLTYSLREIKEILGCIWVEEEKQGKKKVMVEKEAYADNPKQFIVRVIDSAKKELDSCSPYTFDYIVHYSRKSDVGRKAIKAITFIPKYQPKFGDHYLSENNVIQKNKLEMADIVLDHEVKDFLMKNFDLTEEGIVNNWLLWREVKNLENSGSFNLQKTLDILKERASRTRPDDLPKFVIGSLQAILKGYGVDIKKIRADMRAKK